MTSVPPDETSPPGSRVRTAYKEQSGLNFGHVDGLGDDNFYFQLPDGHTLLFVRRANIVLDISALTTDGLAQATTLARLALHRF